MTFDAFISYRRSDGARYAAALRRALLDFRFPRRFAGAPSRRLSIYLDTIYERATDDFFEKTIQRCGTRGTSGAVRATFR